jgi:predicted nucleic acid-binding protein
VIVLDSSFIVAYHNTRDHHHAAAATAMENVVAGEWGPVLLLEYVFVEVVTVLLSRGGLALATTVGATLLAAREVEVVPCSEIFVETLEVFRTQGGERLRFTDAAIVTVARRRDARFVATFDEDFRQVGALTVVPG